MIGELQLDCRIGNRKRGFLSAPGKRLVNIPDEMRHCVVFLGYETPADGEVLAGTAFNFCVEEGGQIFHYLVTAAHVIEGIKQKGAKEVVILVNVRGEGGRSFRVDPALWHFHPTDQRIDVAVMSGVRAKDQEFRVWSASHIATPDVILKEGIGPGDEVCMVGLYTKHAGKTKIVPIVRIGNIAAMADEPCQTKRGETAAYLVEIRSIGGISGSPVFVRPPLRVTWERGNPKAVLKVESGYYLLGLMTGRWDMKHLAPIMFEIDSDYLKQPLNSGIGVVVPAEAILETINQPVFVEDRARQVKERLELGATSTDAEGIG